MSEIIAEKTVVARKEHRCSLCGAIAASKGQEYSYTKYVQDGHVYRWVTCCPCEAVTREVFAADYEDGDYGGVGTDQADEWARDFRATSEIARDYLERRGYTEEDFDVTA